MGVPNKLPPISEKVVPRRKRWAIRRDIFVPWDMFQSPAFRELSRSGICVLLRFLQKRTWIKDKRSRKGRIQFDGTGLTFTYEEAKDVLKISGAQFSRELKKLVELGFLDIEHQGGCYGKDYSRYTLSERWKAYGTPDFVKVEKKRSLQRGLDIQTNIKRKKLLSSVTVNKSEQLSSMTVINNSITG